MSSGTDHADWCFLGALVGDGTGRPATPPRALHVLLPRSDDTIVDDSWDVIGLQGTGAMFPLGITAAVIGIREGALAAHLEIQKARVSSPEPSSATTRTPSTQRARRQRTSRPRAPS